eukprot:CAMPEP_0119316980 /NCGR_PEP_ID=MMETSP1333-20130426/41534_1 /TAXON_ID=418940 /ORGANISM="Scyphosphaera apsteinii, Strain RCC1455" /LENGTH=199 /DNA_ID=CAMNT_0007322773 /DNA_START=78 /DNA_END=677 /DNA_ORIENTATION=+
MPLPTLVVASLALQRARPFARYGAAYHRREALLLGGGFATLFLQPSFAGSTGLSETVGESVRGGGVQILLEDLSMRDVDCPPGFYLPAKGRWDCIEISGTANNQGKRDVSAAAVFGLVRDRDNYPCLSTALDDRMKTGIASLGKVPKGKSPVSFVVAVDSNAPRPLSLSAFKASYRNAAIEKTFMPFDPCEVDSSKCDD